MKNNERCVLIISGTREEANRFVRNYKTDNVQKWFFLENEKELINIEEADVIYTGSYLKRNDIAVIIQKIEFMIAGKKAEVQLIPLNPTAFLYENNI